MMPGLPPSSCLICAPLAFCALAVVRGTLIFARRPFLTSLTARQTSRQRTPLGASIASLTRRPTTPSSADSWPGRSSVCGISSCGITAPDRRVLGAAYHLAPLGVRVRETTDEDEGKRSLRILRGNKIVRTRTQRAARRGRSGRKRSSRQEEREGRREEGMRA